MKGMGSGALLVLAGTVLAACGGEQGAVRGEPSIIAVPYAPSPTSALLSTGPEVTPLPDNLRISIDRPDASAAIKSPVTISGVASVDGGTVVAVVLDAAGAELGRATTKASAAYPAWGRYSVTVGFAVASPGTNGQIRVFGVNPRDGSQSWYYWINVRFP